MNTLMLARLRKLPKWPLWGILPMIFSAAMAMAVDWHSASLRDAKSATATNVSATHSDQQR